MTSGDLVSTRGRRGVAVGKGAKPSSATETHSNTAAADHKGVFKSLDENERSNYAHILKEVEWLLTGILISILDSATRRQLHDSPHLQK